MGGRRVGLAESQQVSIYAEYVCITKRVRTVTAEATLLMLNSARGPAAANATCALSSSLPRLLLQQKIGEEHDDRCRSGTGARTISDTAIGDRRDERPCTHTPDEEDRTDATETSVPA